MPGFEVWDLVKVPFPYTNRPVQQRRPALVIASPIAPGAPELLWVLMVTSAANRGWPGDVAVSDLAAAADLAAGVDFGVAFDFAADFAAFLAITSRTRSDTI